MYRKIIYTMQKKMYRKVIQMRQKDAQKSYFDETKRCTEKLFRWDKKNMYRKNHLDEVKKNIYSKIIQMG